MGPTATRVSTSIDSMAAAGLRLAVFSSGSKIRAAGNVLNITCAAITSPLPVLDGFLPEHGSTRAVQPINLTPTPKTNDGRTMTTAIYEAIQPACGKTLL